MTWVIGRAGPFGYAVGLSDIRVTLRDGTERDCLQKLYYIAPQMVLGFAGSVAIGFEIVNQLSAALQQLEKNYLLVPRVVAENLPNDTRNLFKAFPESEQKCGCQLILLAAHPTENDGDAPWARCLAYRFSSPDFEPELAPPAGIVSIGSGRYVDTYVETLRKLGSSFDILKLQKFHPRGAAFGLMVSISSALKTNPVSGISEHLHICVVGRDDVRFGTNNTITQGDPEEKFQMPPVATSVDELKLLLSDGKSTSIEQARC